MSSVENHNLELFITESDDLDLSNERLQSFSVKLIDPSESRSFVERWHYSKNATGGTYLYSFGLFHQGFLIGACLYGPVAMRNVAQKYVEQEKDLIELRRLCCIDKTPKNTESYFVGKTIRWLKKNSKLKKIISYADPHYGHEGTIYKASNFTYLGLTGKGCYILDKTGTRRHNRTSTGSRIIDGNRIFLPHAVDLQQQLSEGSAKIVKTEGKHIYTYDL